MIQVLVVIRDDGMRDAVQAIVEEGGYAAACCATTPQAVEMLRVNPAPLVVILLHGGRDGDWAPVLNAMSSLPVHAYVLLSTRTQDAPRVWNRHTQHAVPVVPAPFDMAVLLAQIAETAAQLAYVATIPPTLAGPSPRPVVCQSRV